MRRPTMWGLRIGAVCALAQATAACGGHAQDEAGNVTSSKHELRLLDEFGQPVAQTRALIDGKVVVTDDDGRAELGELPASYDAVVAIGTDVRAFLGLKARSPTIEITDRELFAGTEHIATVNISNVKPGPNQVLCYAAGVTGEKSPPQTLGYNSDDQSSWAVISWAASGDEALSAQAFLADFDPATQSVIGYSGFASKTWPHAAQQQSVAWTPDFQAPAFETKTIHVDLNIPADESVAWYSVGIQESSGLAGPIGSFSGGTSADLVVPDLPGASFDVFAALDGPGGSYQIAMHAISAGATVHAEGGVGVQQLAPVDGLMNVTPETDFRWSEQPGSIYELLAFSDSNASVSYNYVIATSGSIAHLPDTSALGVPFPSGLTLQWLARSERGYASVDNYAAARSTETGTGFSGYQKFTTAP